MPPPNTPTPAPETEITPPEGTARFPSGTLAIQNNYFTPQIDLVALGKLRVKDPDMARNYMQIQEQEIQHAQEMDHRIIALEEREQKARLEDAPYARRYADRAQVASFAIVTLSLISAVALGWLGMEKASVATILVGGGVVAVNFLGIRNKGQQ